MLDGLLYLVFRDNRTARRPAFRRHRRARVLHRSRLPSQCRAGTLGLRYDCPLHVHICLRTALGRCRVKYSAPILRHHEGKLYSVEEITCDVQRALKPAIRRNPVNWFWVHNHWRPLKNRA